MPDSDAKPKGSPEDEEFPLHGYQPSAPIPVVDRLSDAELEELNGLLRWNAFVTDGRGRRFGRPTSAVKRNLPGPVPDPRIVDLDRRFDLAGKTVLELGCFEGIHTVGLAKRAARVLACDSRISNLAKAAIRCALFQLPATLFIWDVEKPVPEGQDIDCDILHHVGVLYHLRDPVAHLEMLLPRVRQGLLLDTHYSAETAATELYTSGGKEYRFSRYREKPAHPFAGMYEFARWLPLQDLLAILRDDGFSRIDVADDYQHRFGLRATIYAER